MLKDGGSAFPTNFDYECEQCKIRVIVPTAHSGMSLREWFAGQALIGSLPYCMGDIDLYRTMPRRCYELADQMLKEREKETSNE